MSKVKSLWYNADLLSWVATHIYSLFKILGKEWSLYLLESHFSAKLGCG